MTERDSYDEIILDGMALKLRGVMPDANLATFPRRMVIGDPTKDSNPLLSAWVISDLSGGSGVYDMNESSDASRYSHGNMYTRYPGQISSGNYVTPLTGSTDSQMWFLGDLNVSGTWYAIIVLYSASVPITIIYTLNLPTTLTSIGTLAYQPVGHGVVYRGTDSQDNLVIPYGANGYAYLNQSLALTEVAPSVTDPALLDATVWDDKLIGIDTAGQLWWTTDVTAGWTSYGATAKIPTSETPRRVIPYFDRGGDPAVFVLTELRLWQFDPDGPQIFDIDVSFPPGPYQGIAACRWSGDLYFSVGMGVHRYTGGALSAMGLDRDSGLPVEYNGHIVDLVPGYNSMYALVEKPDLSSFTFPGGAPTPKVSVHEWTGSGWHEVWELPSGNAIPLSAGISRATNGQMLIWGVTAPIAALSGMYAMNLPITFANPRQRITQSTGLAQTSGQLTTGVFDAGMQGYKKVASALDIRMTSLSFSGGGQFLVQYKIDDATSWSNLGYVTTTGVTSLPFGTLTDGIYPGEVFERIQFRFTASVTTVFLMESATLSFVKTVPPSNSWTPTIDLSAEWKGNSPETMRQHIDDILVNRVFVPLVLRGTTYRVMVSASSGSSQTGFDESSIRQISLLEIPQSLGEVA